jgi:hypothetical protein
MASTSASSISPIGISSPRASSSASYRSLICSPLMPAAAARIAASCFLLVAIMATVALAVDGQPTGNSAITALIEASGIASVVGLLVGGRGLAFVAVERSRQ